MKAVTQKLHSRRGATIILALTFFLICAVIGGIVLTSATGNAGRLSHMRGEQQTYLTVSSAAKLVREELGGMRAESMVIEYADAEQEDTEDFYFAVAPGESLADMVEFHAGHIYQSGTPAAAERFTIEAPGEPLANVTAEFSMDAGYNITVTFTPGGGDAARYEMKLTMSAIPSLPDVVGTDTETITTTTIDWEPGTITKGGA